MRDLRDPSHVGRRLLALAESPTRGWNVALSEIADHLPKLLHMPNTRGDESPLERYGDPRDYDVVVETSTRRVRTHHGLLREADETYAAMPIKRLAS